MAGGSSVLIHLMLLLQACPNLIAIQEGVKLEPPCGLKGEWDSEH
jgi:hypothetical protein